MVRLHRGAVLLSAAVAVCVPAVGCGGESESAKVAVYYAAHRKLLEVPERRYFYIAELATQAEALRVKAEVKAGRSLKGMALAEEYSRGELARRGEAGRENERVIFSAKPGALTGPFLLKPWNRHCMLLVYKVTPASYRPLAEVRSTIERELRQRGQL